MAPSATPITALVTWRVTPTYGPTRRSATVSSTKTAPLARKTRAAASLEGSGAACGLGSIKEKGSQIIERCTWLVCRAAALPLPL
jgi:hypothetical protein